MIAKTKIITILSHYLSKTFLYIRVYDAIISMVLVLELMD